MCEDSIADLGVLYLCSSVPIVVKKTRKYKAAVRLTPYQQEAVHGLMLGDVHADRAKEPYNTRLCFDYAVLPYITHLHELFSNFVTASIHSPVRLPDKRTGKVYVSYMFKTLALPALNIFRELYYVPSFGKAIKVIPSNLGEYFTAVSLAYWIMDDGMYAAGGMRLCTDSFTLLEVQFLCKMLYTKFGIECAPQLRNGICWRIYIPKAEMDKVRSLVKPYLLPCMLYKVGL